VAADVGATGSALRTDPVGCGGVHRDAVANGEFSCRIVLDDSDDLVSENERLLYHKAPDPTFAVVMQVRAADSPVRPSNDHSSGRAVEVALLEAEVARAMDDECSHRACISTAPTSRDLPHLEDATCRFRRLP